MTLYLLFTSCVRVCSGGVQRSSCSRHDTGAFTDTPRTAILRRTQTTTGATQSVQSTDNNFSSHASSASRCNRRFALLLSLDLLTDCVL